jgi:transposase-like protein
MRQMKTKQCKCITKKGRRCKNRVPASEKKGLCVVHKVKTAKWKKLKAGALKAAVGLVAADETMQAVKHVRDIYQYLIDHWPEIVQFLHGLDTNVRYSYWHLWVRDCKYAIQASDENEAKKLVSEFKQDYAQLPPQVQQAVISEFGKKTITKLTQ